MAHKENSTAILNHLLLMNGIAVVGVVAHHATEWAILAMVWWADRYRPVSVPNYDQLYGLFHYFLLFIKKLTVCAVPSFLFVSGVFVNYTIRGRSGLSWKIVKSRVASLLIPYVCWSAIYFLFRYVQGERSSLGLYAGELVWGGRFWYIILLSQLYLLSPLLVRAARDHQGQLLFVSISVALIYIALHYIWVYTVVQDYKAPLIKALVRLPFSFVPKLQFFFVLGLVSGFQLSRLKAWSYRFRWLLLCATILFAGLSFLESEIIYGLIAEELWQGSIMSIPATLYVISLILCFIAFSSVSVTRSNHFYDLGKLSLGIYLLHRFILEFVARAIQKYIPWGLAYQLPFYLVLIVSAVEGSRLIMRIVAKSPVRKIYPYLFG